jgi:hypothetical protein
VFKDRAARAARKRAVVMIAIPVLGLSGVGATSAASARPGSALLVGIAREDPGTFLARANACAAPQGAVSGLITDAGGKPQANVPVVVSAESENAVEVGETVHLPQLGWARSSAQGCYSVPLDGPAMLAAADEFGIINLRVTAQFSDRLEVAVLPRDLATQEGEIKIAKINEQGSSPEVLLDRTPDASLQIAGGLRQSFGPQADLSRASRATTTSAEDVAAWPEEPLLERSLDSDSADAAATAEDATLGAPPSRAAAPEGVDMTVPLRSDAKLIKRYGKRPAIVGQWFSRMWGVTQRWSYAKGSTTELGVVTSLSSKAGSWKKTTAQAKSINASVSFKREWKPDGYYFGSYFAHGLFVYYYCDGVACGPIEYRIKPYAWERGADVHTGVPRPNPPSKYCTPYAAGSSDSSEGSKAITWINGVSVGAELKDVIGASAELSSQTGFTSTAQNLVEFTKAGKLCGVSGPLSSNPRYLVAKQ